MVPRAPTVLQGCATMGPLLHQHHLSPIDICMAVLRLSSADRIIILDVLLHPMEFLALPRQRI